MQRNVAKCYNGIVMQLHAQVKLNAYKIIDDIVEKGVRYGYHRAHKHFDKPSEELIVQEVHKAVMNELCEILQFGDES